MHLPVLFGRRGYWGPRKVSPQCVAQQVEGIASVERMSEVLRMTTDPDEVKDHGIEK